MTNEKFYNYVNRCKELGLKELMKRLNIRIKINYNDKENYVDRYVRGVNYYYIISISNKCKDVKTVIWHEIAHILFAHRIGNLKEECQADKFSLEMGGIETEFINTINRGIQKNYYGRYINEALKRKLLLLLKIKHKLGYIGSEAYDSDGQVLEMV